ncbi:hypothetical protein AB0M20_43375, partial [Actinoplanes sp. NPDC051633]
MSTDRVAENGQNTRLLRALVWVGVSLAPVAALVVLLGSSEGPVRFGVLLIAACVVLVGASLLVRDDPVLLRMQVEDRVADEVSVLRDELRSEFAAARQPPAPASLAHRAAAAAPIASAAVPGPTAPRDPATRTG